MTMLLLFMLSHTAPRAFYFDADRLCGCVTADVMPLEHRIGRIIYERAIKLGDWSSPRGWCNPMLTWCLR
jgi:hypothetical protein